MRFASLRRIKNTARLRGCLELTSFPQGGITKIGNPGEADIRAVSGHNTSDITCI